jgi:hypothetical protein
MSRLKGLIIDSPHIDNILSGRKCWEMRSKGTQQRGTIALIKKGSGMVVGVADLVDSHGPLSRDEMLANQEFHLITPERLEVPGVSKWRHAWILKNAKRLDRPVPYSHPNGAVIWVNLDEHVGGAVERAASVKRDL